MNKLSLICLIGIFTSQLAKGQNPTQQVVSDSIMITIMLKHQQDKNLNQLREIQEQNQFLENFPPPSARVVSWYVMMGIGQVVTVRIPASELRTLNLSIENGAWGAFTTEFYPTYDLAPFIAQKKAELDKK